MCWNADVSLKTFSIGATSLLLTTILKNIPVYDILFFLSFMSIQLVEYFIWTYYNQPSLNSLATLVGAIVILLQPVTSMGTMYRSPALHKTMYKMLIIYGLFVLYYISTIKIRDWKETFRSYRGENGHLVWNWMSKKNINVPLACAYMFFFFIPLILNKDLTTLITALITLGVSLFYFYKYDTWATMWCWVSNLVAFALIVKVFIA
jgi:hypothetical protein